MLRALWAECPEEGRRFDYLAYAMGKLRRVYGRLCT
jgi:hypothetical protein